MLLEGFLEIKIKIVFGSIILGSGMMEVTMLIMYGQKNINPISISKFNINNTANNVQFNNADYGILLFLHVFNFNDLLEISCKAHKQIIDLI